MVLPWRSDEVDGRLGQALLLISHDTHNKHRNHHSQRRFLCSAKHRERIRAQSPAPTTCTYGTRTCINPAVNVGTQANVPERGKVLQLAVDRVAHPGQQRGKHVASHDHLVPEGVWFPEAVRHELPAQLVHLCRERWRYLTLRNIAFCTRESIDEQNEMIRPHCASGNMRGAT